MPSPPTSVFGRIRNKFRHGLVLQWCVDQMARVGLEVRVFYLFREGLEDEPPETAAPDGCETIELGPVAMDSLDRVDGRAATADDLRARMREGQRCIAVRLEERIAAFNWVDPNACNFVAYRFDLKPGEAYLYDAHTLKVFRGRNLAPLARRETHKLLRREGCTTLYSISEATNRSALRYKNKLGARTVRKCLYVRLFGLWRRVFTLRDMAPDAPRPGRSV